MVEQQENVVEDFADLDIDALNEELPFDTGGIDIFDSEAMNERAEKWQKGDFNAKLQLEKEYQLRQERPFIIWRKEENKPTKQNPHSKMIVKPFVQHLDHSHSTMDVIIRYYKEGMRIAFHHIPESKDEEREAILGPIRDYCLSRDKEMAQIRREVMAEMGMLAKIKREKEALKKNGK